MQNFFHMPQVVLEDFEIQLRRPDTPGTSSSDSETKDVESPLKCRRCIRQAERHPLPLKGSFVARESCLMPVFGSNLDLVVPRVAVQRREECGIRQAVNSIVHSRD